MTTLFSLIISISLLYVGYNYIRNTQKTIDFFNRHSKDALMKSNLFRNNKLVWMKIIGYGIILFALIIFISRVVVIMKNLS